MIKNQTAEKMAFSLFYHLTNTLANSLGRTERIQRGDGGGSERFFRN